MCVPVPNFNSTNYQGHIMKKEVAAVSQDLETLAEDARALLVATAGIAEEKVVHARKRLAAAIENGRGTLGHLQARVKEGAKATDEMIHEHPYCGMGLAFGVGALAGFQFSRRG
jgi:ElaB/YqjD/DUF883 family membrane-anchored ribosome-binding protein